jgi:hypothetical protein
LTLSDVCEFVAEVEAVLVANVKSKATKVYVATTLKMPNNLKIMLTATSMRHSSKPRSVKIEQVQKVLTDFLLLCSIHMDCMNALD